MFIYVIITGLKRTGKLNIPLNVTVIRLNIDFVRWRMGCKTIKYINLYGIYVMSTPKIYFRVCYALLLHTSILVSRHAKSGNLLLRLRFIP